MSYVDPTAGSAAGRSALELWADGHSALGCMLTIPSPLAAELVIATGYDWVCIDNQHGMMGDETTLAMVQVAGRLVTTIVRVGWNVPHMIMKALDMGADGVIVPMVSNRVQALAAAEACRFPPRGNRSWGPIRAALDRPDLSPEIEGERAFCAVMIETAEAMENLDDIMSVDGVDAVFVGPADLSISHGGLEAPGTTAASAGWMDTILAAARRHDLITGLATAGGEVSARWRDAGYQMVAIHSDAGLLMEAAKSHLAIAQPTSADD
jgi:4-hydroxy-2-oxoheptanedioate aldolase